MASEKTLQHVLDLLTKVPQSSAESLACPARDHAKSMRRIVDSKNVVAVGISEISKRKRTGKLALTFYVDRKVSKNKLRAGKLIPPAAPSPGGLSRSAA